MNLRHQNGFTLWELLITLLVAGILIGIGVPNVMEFSRNGAMTAAANQLLTGTMLARTEAVKRQVPVGLCLSANPTAATPTCSPNPVVNDTTLGFVVWVDENNNFVGGGATGVRQLNDATDGNGVIDAGEDILMRERAPGGTIRVSADCGYVSYGQNGFPRQAPGLCAATVHTFLYCDDRGSRVAAGSLSAARVVATDRPGRAQVYVDASTQANVGVWWYITNRLAGATCPPPVRTHEVMYSSFKGAQRGFSLIEAMVALVVVSVGMIGIAALYGQGLSAGRTALYRTQAVNIAADMADRIRTNRLASVSYNFPPGPAANNSCEPPGAVTCTPAQMASQDLWAWSNQVQTQLPNGTGTVVVAGTSPPTYTITVNWQDTGMGAVNYVLAVRVPNL